MDESAFEERRDTFEKRDSEYKQAMRTVAKYSFGVEDISEQQYREALKEVKEYQRENFHI